MRPPIGGWDEVEGGSLNHAVLWLKELQSYGNTMLDHRIVSAVFVLVSSTYSTGQEVHSLNTRALP